MAVGDQRNCAVGTTVTEVRWVRHGRFVFWDWMIIRLSNSVATSHAFCDARRRDVNLFARRVYSKPAEREFKSSWPGELSCQPNAAFCCL
jgi:hypothetical protein